MYQGVILDFLNMGGGEIALIMVAVLLLFGGKKLPELARGLGKGIREFKDASDGVKREIHRNINNVGLEDELKAEDEKKVEEEKRAEEENTGKELGQHAADDDYQFEGHHPTAEDVPVQSLPLDQQALNEEEDLKQQKAKEDKGTTL